MAGCELLCVAVGYRDQQYSCLSMIVKSCFKVQEEEYLFYEGSRDLGAVFRVEGLSCRSRAAVVPKYICTLTI